VVAIKTTKLRKEPARIHNIAMEIYLMQLCAHENVLLYKRSFYWHKSVYSILEFCNGGSLTSLRKVRLTEVHIRVLFRQLLKGTPFSGF
jgi:serine/threonine protein kinase